MGAMLNEMVARAQYVLSCAFLVDNSWDMGADLTGSLFPWGGYWVNSRGTFDRYADVETGAF